MTNEQRFDRLNGWLDVLEREVRQLRIDQHIFWEVQEMIRQNPRINNLGSSFYHWMGSAYATSMAVAIRRQVDDDSRSISFRNFLIELRRHPEMLSRARYKRIFVERDSAMPEKYQDEDYDRQVGKGRDTVESSDVDKEIAQLKAVTKALCHYVNKRIAHYDEERFTNFPHFDDVDVAADYLEHLVMRYLHLFRAMSMNTVLPIWQYDWKEIFRHPWILARESTEQE